jgi:hypothetical protein
MKNFFFFQVSVVLLLTVTCAFGQRSTPRTPSGTRDSLERKVERQAENDRRQVEIQSRLKKDSSESNKNYLPVKPKRSKEQDALLRPDVKNFDKYASLLQQPKTGLIRLLPDRGCQSDNKVIRAAEQCSNYIPGSSFYSFREKEYTLEGLADIVYRNGVLISNPYYAQGLLTILGDVLLENVSPESEEIKILSQYQPAVDEDAALKQFAELSKGIINGKQLLRNTVPVGENITYALRVIAYRGDFFQTLLEEDERKDILLIFRVVQDEKDKGITLLWKEFFKKESPRLIISKEKKTAQK